MDNVLAVQLLMSQELVLQCCAPPPSVEKLAEKHGQNGTKRRTGQAQILYEAPRLSELTA